MADSDDFYEDDEPIDELLRRFDAAQKHYTARPAASGVTVYVDAESGRETCGPTTESAGELVSR